MFEFKWYHVPIIAVFAVLEVLEDFWHGDFKMSPRDWFAFLCCLLLVLAQVGLLGWLLWYIVKTFLI